MSIGGALAAVCMFTVANSPGAQGTASRKGASGMDAATARSVLRADAGTPPASAKPDAGIATAKPDAGTSAATSEEHKLLRDSRILEVQCFACHKLHPAGLLLCPAQFRS